MFDLAVRQDDGLLHKCGLRIRGTVAFAEKQARKHTKGTGLEHVVVAL